MIGLRPLVLLALAAPLLAGCGSSSSSPTTASTAAAAPATQSAATPAPSTKAATKAVAISIKDFAYSPVTTRVATGAKVSWKNLDDANHTVTFDAGSMKSLGNQRTGQTVSMRFTKAGTYAYHCDFHPNMHGTVVVG